MLLRLNDINKFYHGNQVLSHVSLTVEDQDRIGLVGVNGCGKSTLLRILTGQELPDHIVEGDGEVAVSGKTTIGYLEQMGGLEKDSTVWEEMRSVFRPLLETQKRMHQLEAAMQEGDLSGADEYHRLQTWFEDNDGYQIDVKIRTVLNGMGFAPDTYDRVISGFSGGEKTRLAIAQLLLEAPNLLILDEPTNHLDFQTVMWLEDYLKDYKGALLLVSHDRYFLDRLCTSVCEIERGKLTRYKGNYTAFTQLKEAAVARQWKEYEMQQKEIAKLEDYVARNLTRASTAKSAQSRVKQLEKMERIEKPPAAQKQARIQFTYEADPPVELLKVQGIDISVGEGAARKTLLPELSFEVRRGEKWGIIGENGIGKSTLLKIIQGKLPHLGKARWTSNVKISYFEQESTNLHPAKSVMQEIHDRVPSWTDLEVRKLLGQVRLTGENVFKPVGVLSGGERAKVCFAVMMLEHGNVLILDEPTNHLDIAMKEVIEDAMETFGGTILFVSHDRYLLDRVADHILELKADGASVYQGGFSAWRDAQQKASAAEAAAAAETQEPRPPKGEKPAYRSKKQRSQQAKFRADLRSLEQNLDRMQEELDQLTAELADEAVCSDYQLMQEKCARMEELRVAMDETMEKMIELEDALS
ncbi:ABC-F family ATP-binding cassette domain-containing protein [uncultured Ruminococcus sp.]|uniref:ABC-F family ATP-binding cassette domain-containing protein n=1 Tax=uncultured Ruminococcus sp. TaxID=165186 RepID=UPI0025DD2F97|nr:ABC-F type ribosomal protection protein [uncultured Ruminococcus sp.]